MARRPLRSLSLARLFASIALAEATQPRVWTVFCAECTNNFDYKSIGVFYSHNISGMPGGITRLLACDEEQLRSYKGLHIGPTLVHKNYARVMHTRELGPGETTPPAGSARRDISPSYNKPGSIMHWVNEAPEAKRVDYVLYIDADMLLRLPMDPIKMGVKRGVVVSEHVGYIDVGLRNGIANMFLPPELAGNAARDLDNHRDDPNGKWHASAGWYHFFHIEDIAQIAHRWYYYCEKMRLNPQLYWKITGPDGRFGGTDHDIITGDAYVTHGTAPWISEMYGYVFAASEAGFKHILTHGVVVYPDDIGSGRPDEASIIHYGLHCQVGAFHFTKYTHGNFNAMGCTGEIFGDPPQPTYLERLCAETVWTLNDAMCDFYDRPKAAGGCGISGHSCPHWKPAKARACLDTVDKCSEWAKLGECASNPGYMLGACPRACGKCSGAPSAEVPAWARALALARGETPKPLKPASADAEDEAMAADRPSRDRRSLDRLARLRGDEGAAEDESVRELEERRNKRARVQKGAKSKKKSKRVTDDDTLEMAHHHHSEDESDGDVMGHTRPRRGVEPVIAPAPASKRGHDEIVAMKRKLEAEEKRLQRASEVEPELSYKLGFVWVAMLLLFGWLLARRLWPRHVGPKRVRYYGSDD